MARFHFFVFNASIECTTFFKQHTFEIEAFSESDFSRLTEKSVGLSIEPSFNGGDHQVSLEIKREQQTLTAKKNKTALLPPDNSSTFQFGKKIQISINLTSPRKQLKLILNDNYSIPLSKMNSILGILVTVCMKRNISNYKLTKSFKIHYFLKATR